MDKLKGLRAGVSEMRSVAQRLMTWADDLEKSFQEVKEPAAGKEPAPAPAEPKKEPSPAAPTRAEVKSILTKKCSSGYSAQVKALIASFGVSSLSAVPEGSLGELLDAALLLGEDDSGGGAEDAG